MSPFQGLWLLGKDIWRCSLEENNKSQNSEIGKEVQLSLNFFYTKILPYFECNVHITITI